MTKQRRVSLGSVSHGTMRTEDLIPEFVDTLERITGGCPLVDEIRGRMDNEGYYESEEADWDLNESLFDALNQYAPQYCYFGSHPGDGCDYGFWHSEEAIDDAVHDGELVKLSDVPDFANHDVDVWQGAEFALVVNDHGNCTLYDREGNELWAIV